jgi:hypothetical protein
LHRLLNADLPPLPPPPPPSPLRGGQRYFGRETFASAYARTGRIVCIAVSTVWSGGGGGGGGGGASPLLMSYVTTPDVLLYSAVAASCAAPGLMRPVTLLARTRTGAEVPYHPVPGVHSVDGSVAADIPAQALGLLFHCNRTIVSQANPHVVPFMAGDGEAPRARIDTNPLSRALHAVELTLHMDVRARTKYLAKMRLLPRFFGAELSQLLLQRYSGDVTIMPEQPLMSQWRALSQPSEADMVRFIAQGQRATWPALAHIRTLVAVERKLSACVRRFAFTPHAVVPTVAGHVLSITPAGGGSARRQRSSGGEPSRVQSYTVPSAAGAMADAVALAAALSASGDLASPGGLQAAPSLPTLHEGGADAEASGGPEGEVRRGRSSSEAPLTIAVPAAAGGRDGSLSAHTLGGATRGITRRPVSGAARLRAGSSPHSAAASPTFSTVGQLGVEVSPPSPLFPSTLAWPAAHGSAAATGPMSAVSSVRSMSPLPGADGAMADGAARWMVAAGRAHGEVATPILGAMSFAASAASLPHTHTPPPFQLDGSTGTPSRGLPAPVPPPAMPAVDAGRTPAAAGRDEVSGERGTPGRRSASGSGNMVAADAMPRGGGGSGSALTVTWRDEALGVNIADHEAAQAPPAPSVDHTSGSPPPAGPAMPPDVAHLQRAPALPMTPPLGALPPPSSSPALLPTRPLLLGGLGARTSSDGLAYDDAEGPLSMDEPPPAGWGGGRAAGALHPAHHPHDARHHPFSASAWLASGSARPALAGLHPLQVPLLTRLAQGGGAWPMTPDISPTGVGARPAAAGLDVWRHHAPHAHSKLASGHAVAGRSGAATSPPHATHSQAHDGDGGSSASDSEGGVVRAPATDVAGVAGVAAAGARPGEVGEGQGGTGATR